MSYYPGQGYNGGQGYNAPPPDNGYGGSPYGAPPQQCVLERPRQICPDRTFADFTRYGGYPPQQAPPSPQPPYGYASPAPQQYGYQQVCDGSYGNVVECEGLRVLQTPPPQQQYGAYNAPPPQQVFRPPPQQQGSSYGQPAQQGEHFPSKLARRVTQRVLARVPTRTSSNRNVLSTSDVSTECLQPRKSQCTASSTTNRPDLRPWSTWKLYVPIFELYGQKESVVDRYQLF